MRTLWGVLSAVLAVAPATAAQAAPAGYDFAAEAPAALPAPELQPLPAQANTPTPSAQPVPRDPRLEGAVDRVKALPRRPVRRRHRFELTPQAALSVNDGFYLQGLAGGALQFYLNEEFSLGVAADWLYGRVPTENLTTLRQVYFSVPTPLQRPRLLAQAMATWTLLQGKAAVGRRGLYGLDLFVSAGAGVAPTFAGRTPVAAFFAIGQHVVLGNLLALRLELRDALFIATQPSPMAPASRLQQVLTLAVGMSFLLPGQGAARW